MYLRRLSFLLVVSLVAIVASTWSWWQDVERASQTNDVSRVGREQHDRDLAKLMDEWLVNQAFGERHRTSRGSQLPLRNPQRAILTPWIPRRGEPTQQFVGHQRTAAPRLNDNPSTGPAELSSLIRSGLLVDARATPSPERSRGPD